MTDSLRSAKIKSCHLDRSAIVYIRQSTTQQVANNRESTALQYRLADRAVELGWPLPCVEIIDEDQGHSAGTSGSRLGFQRMLAEVALDHVGIIFSFDASRLSRNGRDWEHLLELCARFHTLIADADSVWDPSDDHDRFYLGLKGTICQAELSSIKARMQKGKLNKARRGEMFNLPPIGYVKLPNGRLDIDPDGEVQAVVRLLFDEFDRQQTLHGLLRYLAHHKIQIPVRARDRDNQGQLQWHKPNRATLSNLLHHPIYAGAYRYGHRPSDPRKKVAARPNVGKTVKEAEECLVLIRDHLPAYITWERYQSNRRKLEANRNTAATPGTPRQGAALLKGLIRCGRCGVRMHVRYCGAKNATWYGCTSNSSSYADPFCQGVSGAVLDDLLSRQILAAVEPAALEASLAAVADVEQQRARLQQRWTLKIERANYEVERAARQYQKCEPENRLVARELERRWEETLVQRRVVLEEYEAWKMSAPQQLSEEDRQAIGVLAEDLPALWHAETTTPQDRQRIARLLIERVTVIVDKDSDNVDVKARWMGGQESEHRIKRPVSCYEQQAEYPRLVARLGEMCQQRLSTSEMAEKLNAEGFRPPKRTDHFSGEMVQRLTAELGLERRKRTGSKEGLEADEYRPGELSRKLAVKRDTVVRWMRVGWLNVRRDEDGNRIIWADEDELRRLTELHSLPMTWANKERLAELKKPKERPAK